jgi:hypothetical protein
MKVNIIFAACRKIQYDNKGNSASGDGNSGTKVCVRVHVCAYKRKSVT